jgi:hypothetical protein
MPFRIWIGIKNDANPHADPAQVLYMLENQNFFQFSGTFTTEPFHIDYPDRQLLCVLDLLIPFRIRENDADPIQIRIHSTVFLLSFA